MRRNKNFFLKAGLTVLLILPWNVSRNAWADGDPRKLPGHRVWAMAQPSDMGEVEKGRRFLLAVSLPLRNPDDLNQLLQDLYNPQSPSYHQFLSPEQFTVRYGPTAQDAQAVADYLSAKGLKVTKIHSNRVIVDVEGNNDAIEKAFHVRLHNYRRNDGTVFYGPDNDPSVDLNTTIQDVSGLDNFIPPRRAGRVKKPAAPRAMGGSGGGGSNFGIDFRNAYASNVTLTGAGQTIALVEYSTYYATDIPPFKSLAPTSNAQAATMYASFGALMNTYLDGYTSSTTPTDADEVAIDIEMAYSMAPAAAINVYMGDGNATPDDVLNQIATDGTCKQISSSWTSGNNDNGAEYAEYMAQGQSYFNASADSGAYTGTTFPNNYSTWNVNFPYITMVGGTELTMSGSTYSGEVVWNDGGGHSSGGGVMNYLTIPLYQQGINMTANGGSTVHQNAPDISACAFYIYGYESGGWGTHWGTSFATPLWAGFVALVNQQAALQSLPSVGFASPALYAIGKNPAQYAADFHDITSGTIGAYNAVAGYDLCTGWGSPNGQSLINDILAMTPTATPTNTATSTATATASNTPSNTSTATSTNTSFSTATNTVTNTPTVTTTNVLTNTATPTNTGTNTPTSTATNSVTNTTTATSTDIMTNTATNTPTITETLTSTPSMTATQTPTMTSTVTVTDSSTPTGTPSLTPSSTVTFTRTLTATFTVTVSSTPTATPTQVTVVLAYPNPVTGPGSVLFQLSANLSGSGKVEVFTVASRCVKKVSLNQLPAGGAIPLDLTDNSGVALANGLYFVRITTAKAYYIVKLLILR